MKTMIYLPESVHTKLKHMAVDERTSMAEIIRQAIELYLKTPARKGGGKL
jgi:ribbon-helix-helix CopG family protein